MKQQEWIVRALLLLMRMLVFLIRNMPKQPPNGFYNEMMASRSHAEETFKIELGQPRDLDP